MQGEKTVKMQLRCVSCRHFFDVDSPVGIEATAWCKWMLDVRCPACSSRTLTIGQGRSLSEDRSTRKTDPGASIPDRVADWVAGGELGSSAAAIVMAHTGTAPYADVNVSAHPEDVGGFLRCLLLLDRFPEWASLKRMRAVSAAWRSFADLWPDATAAAFAELGPDLAGGRAPNTSRILFGPPSEDDTPRPPVIVTVK